jgi:hypothetical protein
MACITLAEIADRTAVLSVACNRCDRAGHYSLPALIAEHGAECGIPTLLGLLSAECLNRAALSVYESCGVHCPELSALFMRRGIGGEPLRLVFANLANT